MLLCGLDVSDRSIMRLARLVEDEEVELKLRKALARDDEALTLNRAERATILLSLDDPPQGGPPPAGLDDLRTVLVNERAWLQSRDNVP